MTFSRTSSILSNGSETLLSLMTKLSQLRSSRCHTMGSIRSDRLRSRQTNFSIQDKQIFSLTEQIDRTSSLRQPKCSSVDQKIHLTTSNLVDSTECVSQCTESYFCVCTHVTGTYRNNADSVRLYSHDGPCGPD